MDTGLRRYDGMDADRAANDAVISQRTLSQSQAAKLFGVTQPRVSDLMRGKIELFGIDTLVNMLAAAGLHVEVRVGKAA